MVVGYFLIRRFPVMKSSVTTRVDILYLHLSRGAEISNFVQYFLKLHIHCKHANQYEYQS